MKKRSNNDPPGLAEFLGAKNVVLIGMPGAGKSTAGVLLAKRLALDFIDTDLLVQSNEGLHLQDIVNAIGIDAFQRMEEKHVVSIEAENTVISTGGSVIYSEKAMAHLKENGVVVYLSAPLELIRARITNMDSRGIVMAPGQTLDELYEERLPLYRRYADTTVESSDKTHEDTVEHLMEQLDSYPGNP